MNIVDHFVAYFSPYSGVRRMQARKAMAILSGYEADKPSPYRKIIKDIRSAESLAGQSAPALRAQARYLERNLDIADHALNALANTVIGHNGVGIQPMPLNNKGEVHREFAMTLKRMIDDWSMRPEVTRKMNFAKVQRLGLRSWVRDGEHFTQLLPGDIAGLTHSSDVPLSLELLEADYVPYSINDPDKRIVHGIQTNSWGQAVQYHVLKGHPGDTDNFMSVRSTKTIPAGRMVHAALVKRFHQVRGVSLFASVFIRLQDIKDFEDSERIAAKVAASMTAYIKKGLPEDFTNGDEANRNLKFRPGMIFDDLRPGEDVGTIDTSRPNSNAEGFLNLQMRRASGGLNLSYSSFSKDYNGTYSAQRQELVEQWNAYEVMGADYVDQMINPIVANLINLAVLSGVVQIPSDLDRSTLGNVVYQMQAMPWIDPDKEAKGIERGIRLGIMSTPEGVRRRGKDPEKVYQEEKIWRDRSDDDGMVFTGDPSHDLNDHHDSAGGQNGNQNNGGNNA